MPRGPRVEASGALHHVVAKGNAGAAITLTDNDRDLLLDRLGRTITRHRWSCLAYCILDTHLHLVVGTAEPNLGLGMKWLLGPYAQAFNERHERRGHLFCARFYSKRIESDEHLVSTIVYVALNPVRAGMVDEPGHWPWSSYASTVGRARPPSFLDVEASLELVDSRPDVARRAFELGVRGARERDVSARKIDALATLR
jgi:putative transposase